MPGDAIARILQLHAEVLLQHAQRGDGIGHDRGLSIGRQREFGIRPFAHQREQLLVQRVVDFLKGLARGGAGFGEVGTHADLLAPLPGEDESSHNISLLPAA